MKQFEILLLYWKKNIDMFYLVLVYVVVFLCVIFLDIFLMMILSP